MNTENVIQFSIVNDNNVAYVNVVIYIMYIVYVSITFSKSLQNNIFHTYLHFPSLAKENYI